MDNADKAESGGCCGGLGHSAKAIPKKTLIIAGVVTAVVIAAIVGAVVGTQAAKNSSGSSDSSDVQPIAGCGAATAYSSDAAQTEGVSYWFSDSTCCSKCPVASVGTYDCGGGLLKYVTQCASGSAPYTSYYSPAGLSSKAAPACSATDPSSTTATKCSAAEPKAAATAAGGFFTEAPKAAAPVPAPTPAPSSGKIVPSFGVPRKLLWSDEFDGTALNTDIWTPYVGNGCEQKATDGTLAPNCGFGNGELQSYEAANVYVQGGSLYLNAELLAKPLANTAQIASGKVTSNAPYTAKFGRVEALITLPFGIGLWPSFFLLPVNETYGPWPASGEIDILETYNIQPSPVATPVLSSLHYGTPVYLNGPKGQNGCVLMDGRSLGGEPHVFALEWSPESLKFYVDNYLFCEMTQWWTENGAKVNADPSAPFDDPFYITLALAVGGQVPQVASLAQLPPDTLPAQLKIDYVRVFAATAAEMAWINPFPGPIVPAGQTDGWFYAPEPASGAYHIDLQTDSQSPFVFTPALVRIENEYFDFGGEGVGYHELTPLTNEGTCALRPYDGVDVHEENIYIPPLAFKFGDSGGAYVRYMATEWTAYSITVPKLYPFLFVEVRHSTLTPNARFKLIADSFNCANPEADGGITLLETQVVLSHLAVQPPSPALGLEDVSPCWQQQFFQAAGPLPVGDHTLVFCSLTDNLNVSYMNFTPYPPTENPVEGPGCN
eukprot:TRINITY_DN1664_c0_g1_i1.p1 TRINITY_DN1664_c0_g1~~TRINITY_DN1664_c0_g1_i1.p1  ORF type:complete len:719 (-),score=172.09 TRINITY_DN1664_c0_g1_i1:888-3044(-)